MPAVEFSGVEGAVWVVPEGVTHVTITARGTRGGQGTVHPGGAGGEAKATYPVTVGETLIVNAPQLAPAHLPSGGGRAADVRQGGGTLEDRIIVGAGGGAYGLFVGAISTVGAGGSPGGGEVGGGNGGTQTAGGPGGSPGGSAGTFGSGGNGANGSDGQGNSWQGGRGGDGWYGGGGGRGGLSGVSHTIGGGGGGSCYTGHGTDAEMRRGVHTSTIAYVLIEWDEAVAPHAPVLIRPVAQPASSAAHVVEWEHSHALDAPQTGWAVQIRPQGETSTVVDESGSDAAQTFEVGPLPTGGYEWRAATASSSGGQGPWTSWQPYTVEDPPGAPAIVEPADGSTAASAQLTVIWSASESQTSQVRVTDDDGGEPGEIVWSSPMLDDQARSFTVPLPDNLTFRHIQVRHRAGGLWSPWASVRVDVDYVPPPGAQVTVTVDDPEGAVYVGWQAPPPDGMAEPVTAHLWRRRQVVRHVAGVPVEVWDDDPVHGGGETGIRLVAAADVDDGYVDWTPAAGLLHEYRVELVSTADVSSWSDWSGEGDGPGPDPDPPDPVPTFAEVVASFDVYPTFADLAEKYPTFADLLVPEGEPDG